MGIRTGIGTRIGLGEESTWGTSASRSVTARLSSTSLQRRATFVPLPHLVGSTGTSRVRAEKYQSGERTGGDIKLVACYEGNALGILLKHSLGGLSDGGSGPTYTHTFTVGDALPTGLSVELQRGMDGASASTAEAMYGIRVQSWALEVSAGGVMEYTATMLGKTGQARATQSVPALSSALYPILHAHAGQLAFNSNNFTLAKFKLSGSNKLGEIQELGSNYVSDPPVVDFADLLLECEVVSRSDQLYTEQLAGTQGDVTITFTDVTNAKSMAFTLHNGVMEEDAEDISGPGEIRLRCRWRLFSGPSESGLSLVITNATASGIAA